MKKVKKKKLFWASVWDLFDVLFLREYKHWGLGMTYIFMCYNNNKKKKKKKNNNNN